MGVCLVVIMPWWVRNLTVFDDPTFLATGNGVVLQVSNCDGTYSGQFLGLLGHQVPHRRRAAGSTEQQRKILEGTQASPASRTCTRDDPRDDSELDTDARKKAFDVHRATTWTRLPVVVAARVGRIWGVFRPEQDVELRHLLRTPRQVDVVGGRVHVLRAACRSRCTRWSSCASGVSPSRR